MPPRGGARIFAPPAAVGDGRCDALAAGLGSRQAERGACAEGEGWVAGHRRGARRGEEPRMGAAIGAKILAPPP